MNLENKSQYVSFGYIGYYYLNSRYYDPEVGRFISADTSAVLGVSGDLYDKNLYAYCDNNPVMRYDISGELWGGVLIGFATVYVGDVISNITNGKTGVDIFQMTSSAGTYFSAMVTGAIPGVGLAARIIRPIAGTSVKFGIDCEYNGDEFSLKGAVIDLALGIAGEGASAKISKKYTVMHLKTIPH